MAPDEVINDFLEQYSGPVAAHAQLLRKMLKTNLPGIIEELDAPAKLIGYSYGARYTDLICVLIPSKKGLKLGFNKGPELPDPDKLLQGTGKVSRYVEITGEEQIHTAALKKLLSRAFEAYKQRTQS